MFLPAVFGIKSSGLNLAANLVLLFLVVVWLALVYWTYADARRRIADPMLIGCATAASLFPFVGTIVYMIVRPPEYLEDVRERELEMQASEARLSQVGYHLCPHCDAEVEKDFLRCPSCMRKLKDPCKTCGRPLDPNWKLCPFCESEVGSAAAPTRRTRRRRETSAAERAVAAERREPAPVTAERRESAAARDRRESAAARDRRESAAGRDGHDGREPATEKPSAPQTQTT
jgi:hypothetical protein